MQLLARIHSGGPAHTQAGHETAGLKLDRGWRYDLEVWIFDTFLVRGRIRRLRQTIVDQAQLETGGALLDVGCGTGNLAIAAARRLAGKGRVVGIDPAPRQLSRARSKARRQGLVQIEFQPGAVEELPFPDATFDVVTSSLMMHHLPPDLRVRGLKEIYRVLKPNGRFILADFDYADGAGRREHPSSNGLVEATGFINLESEHLGLPGQHRGWSGITITSATKGASVSSSR